MPDTKTREVLFASTFSEHRLVMDPVEYQWEGSRLLGETKGHTIEFKRGTFRTEDPAEIAFLREKMQTNPAIYEIPVQVPDPSPVLVELATASLDRVQEILSEERDGWEREPILQAAAARLAASEATHEPAEAPHGYKADGVTPKKGPGGRPPKEA